MNLIVLLDEDFSGSADRVRLTGRRYQHLTEIQRVEMGSRLRVGRLNGSVGEGCVTELGLDFAELEVSFHHPPPSSSPITLVLALPRPPVLKRVLISATSMGVKRIVLLGAAAVEKSFWQSHALRDESIFDQLILGLEQGRDTQLPQVELRPRFRPFVEDEVLTRLGSGQLYVAHPAPIPCLPSPGREGDLLVIGPEAGWNEFELNLWDRLEAQRVSLGSRPLRVEAAVPALLGRFI
ncbi:MAG: 16S rRNA (uracil(1498)-N(3))-methyltransferase [Deltaproteobacteria bacterium]|nr:16S rRNA (uracil(1498)-N(3))-methyltransferase [Deltaproteobacteria bacterium]